MTSKCDSISSDSLNCPFTRICCHNDQPTLNIRSSIPSDRPNELDGVDGSKFEQLNQPDCGRSGVQINNMIVIAFNKVYFLDIINFVLGGNDVPEGALPFMVSFIHVSSQACKLNKMDMNLIKYFTF